MIPFFVTHVSSRAKDLVCATLASTHLSEGPRVSEFEHQLEDMLGLRHAVALNSGTTALHLALVCGDICPGDEVILPSQTFIASGLSIIQQGAIAVFADISPDTGNLDPDSVRRAITSRTRAIMPVHWGGYPCEMDELQAIAREHGLWLIEDAAHALGARYRGRPMGTYSRFAAFSFQAIKHITTGDGGLVTCESEIDWEQARRRRWFGIDRTSSRPSLLGEREYDVAALGFKYHMNDFAASLGLANLPDLPAILARRKKIALTYRRELLGIPGLQLLENCDDRESAWWLFTVRVDRRLDFITALKDRGVPASVVHLGIHRNTIFCQREADLPGQRVFDQTQVALPVHQELSDDDVQHIIRAVRQGW